MRIWFFCPLWGSCHLGWETFFARVREAGYDGVEMSLPLEMRDQEPILRLLENYGLKWVAQNWETNAPDAAAHLETFERHLYNLAAAKPLFINSQSGKDFFSFADNLNILQRA